MGLLSFTLLGTPEVRHAGAVLTFPTRKALALLVYLAVEGGLHPREKLAALFWPDRDQEHARAMLRYTLSTVRHTLGDATDAPHLTIERDALGFDDTSAVEMDVHVLHAASTQARDPVAAGNPSGGARPVITALQEAAERCRGEFLAGFSLRDAPAFDDWVSLQRAVWHQQMTLVFDRLSRLQADGGELADATATVTQWLTRDPVQEEAHRRLMHLHLAAGDRTAALRAYDACRALLDKELHATPAPETEALADRIRTAVPPQHVPSRAPPAARRPPTFLEGPLVGRTRQFVQLVELYHAARQDGPRVAILHGEPGIGKTRLAREFLGWATGHGADVLQGRAFETGGRLPYQPLVDALRPRLEQVNAPEDLLSDI